MHSAREGENTPKHDNVRLQEQERREKEAKKRQNKLPIVCNIMHSAAAVDFRLVALAACCRPAGSGDRTVEELEQTKSIHQECSQRESGIRAARGGTMRHLLCSPLHARSARNNRGRFLPATHSGWEFFLSFFRLASSADEFVVE